MRGARGGVCPGAVVLAFAASSCGAAIEEEVNLRRRVLDGDTGAPIAGATVDWGEDELIGSSAAPRPHSLTSDAEGGIEFPGPEQPGRLFLTAPGYGPRMSSWWPEAGADTAFVPLFLSRAATVQGRVLDGAGEPIAGSFVLLAPVEGGPFPGGELFTPHDRDHPTSPSPAGVRWSAVTDDEGRFRFEGVTARERLTLHIDRDATYTPPTADFVHTELLCLAPGEVLDGEWFVAGEAVVRGTLRDQHGAPVAGEPLWLLPPPGKWMQRLHADDEELAVATTSTGEDGTFALTGIRPGRWCLGSSPLQDLWSAPRAADVAPVFEEVVVPASATEVVVDLVLPRGLSFTGRVLDHEGVPVADATLYANSSDRMAWVTFTGEDGTFRFHGLRDEELRLVVVDWPWVRHPDEDLPQETRFRFQGPRFVRPGDAGVEFRLARGATIRGRVGGPDEGSGFRPTVVLTPLDQEPLAPGRGPDIGMLSADDGEFVVHGLAPGRYGFLAGDFGTQAARLVTITAGQAATSVDLELGPPAFLRLVRIGGTGAASANVSADGVSGSLAVLLPHEATVLAVVPGDLEVILRAHDGPEQRRELALAAGEWAEVRFEE